MVAIITPAFYRICDLARIVFGKFSGGGGATDKTVLFAGADASIKKLTSYPVRAFSELTAINDCTAESFNLGGRCTVIRKCRTISDC